MEGERQKGRVVHYSGVIVAVVGVTLVIGVIDTEDGIRRNCSVDVGGTVERITDNYLVVGAIV